MQNELLGLMPMRITDQLADVGSAFSVKAGATIPKEGVEGPSIYMVNSGVASIFQRSKLGHYSEIGMVGREGALPICALLNIPSVPQIVIAQIGPLTGIRIPASDFVAIVGSSREAAQLVRKYVYFFVTQIASNIMNSERNSILIRVSRWLLMCHDRISGDEIRITHEMLAQMSFAHRPTVTNALKELSARGLLDIARGTIHILDRDGLRALADDSYGLAEAYWRENCGPWGQDEIDLEEVEPSVAPQRNRQMETWSLC